MTQPLKIATKSPKTVTNFQKCFGGILLRVFFALMAQPPSPGLSSDTKFHRFSKSAPGHKIIYDNNSLRMILRNA